MKVTSYQLNKTDTDKSLSIVIPTKSISGNLFKEAKTNLEKISESMKENITLTAIEDSGESFSFSKSVNKGLEEINADIYLNMNDDVTLSGNSLEKAIKVASSMNTVVGAILNYPDGHIQHAGMSLDLVSSTIDGSFIGYFLIGVLSGRNLCLQNQPCNFRHSPLYFSEFQKKTGYILRAFRLVDSFIQ